MRIIIYGINYAPELTGIGKYTGEMAEWLAAQGHEISIITAMPYYPEWFINKKYRGKLWHVEYRNGVKIYRCPLYVPAKVTSIKRIIHEFSFLASVFPVWCKTIFNKKFDIVVYVSPPFHVGLLPLLYSKIRQSKLITHIQDLQVDAAKDLGMISNKFFLNLMFRIEKIILKNSAAVSTISLGMQKKIEAKGIDVKNIIMFPNWVDETLIKPLPKDKSLRNEFGLKENDKVVLYAGNLGEKQGLEAIIEAAAYFNNNSKIHFIIAGTGGGKERLQLAAKTANLTNIRFLPLQPYEKLSALLATADLHLVLQKKSAADLVMPSKLTGILASGGCAIITASIGSTLYEIIDKFKMGILVEPESSNALIEAINNSFNINLDEYKINARKYAEKYIAKDSILWAWENNLQNLLGG